MIKLDIDEAKTHLPRYLARLSDGETILLCKRNMPVAEIRAIVHACENDRPLGLAKERFEIPDTFFEPLPDARVIAFDGQGNEPDC